MKMLRKIIDGNSLGISQKNVYDGASFSKVTNLQCSDCNFAINMCQKLAVLKNIFRKKSMVDHLLNKVATP